MVHLGANKGMTFLIITILMTYDMGDITYNGIT
jgi:hypothetical protein